MCPAERERDQSGRRASGLTPDLGLPVHVVLGCITIANSWIDLGSFVFAQWGGYETSLDFTRAGHRIVQATLRLSFCFAAPEA